MRNARCQRRRFTGSGRGQNTEIFPRGLADNSGLLIVERDCTFAELESIIVETTTVAQSVCALDPILAHSIDSLQNA
jgi:hypothetical protein